MPFPDLSPKQPNSSSGSSSNNAICLPGALVISPDPDKWSLSYFLPLRVADFMSCHRTITQWTWD